MTAGHGSDPWLSNEESYILYRLHGIWERTGAFEESYILFRIYGYIGEDRSI